MPLSLIVLGLVAMVCVGLVVLAKPDIGLGLLAFAVFTRLPEHLEKTAGIPTLTLPFALVVGVVAAYSNAVRLGRRPGRLPAVGLIVVIQILLLGVGRMIAEDRAAVDLALAEFPRDAVIVLVIVAAMTTPRALRALVWGAICSGIVMGGVAVVQYLEGSYVHSFFGLGIAPLATVVANETSGFRAAGPLGDPNFFAQVLIVLLALGFERALRERRPFLRLIALASAALCLAALILTFSRGGVLALAAVIVVALLIFKVSIRVVTAIGVLALVAVLIVPTGFAQRFSDLTQVTGGSQQITDNAIRGRLSEMTASVLMAVEHPVLGVGPRNFPVHYPRYANRLGLEDNPDDRNSHSLPLQQAAEGGVVGFTFFLVVVGVGLVGLRRTGRTLRAEDDTDTASMLDGVFLAFVGFLAAGVFLHLAYQRYFWFLVAVSWAAPQLLGVTRRRVSSPTAPVLVDSAP